MSFRALRHGLLLSVPLWALIGLAVAHARDCDGMVMPPTYLDYAPTPADHIVPLDVPFWDVDKTCRGFGAQRDGRMWGCEFSMAGSNFIVYPKGGTGLPDYLIACTKRHEIAHVHGWPSDHPDGSV